MPGTQQRAHPEPLATPLAPRLPAPHTEARLPVKRKGSYL